MNDFDVRKKIDILMTLLIAYFFIICLSFEFLEMDGSLENYFILEVVMIIGLISYYSNITFSLVMTVVVDFAYMSYKLYSNMVNNVTIKVDTYFWIIMLPITVLLVSLVSKNVIKLQKRVENLKNENFKLVMIDESTNIKNERALLIELPIYMKMSKRHNIPVTLFIVKVKFADKLIKILGKKEFETLLIQSSNVFEKSLREEDVKYRLDYRTFAFLTITDKNGVSTVKQRIKENIDKYDFTKDELYKNVKLDIQIGSYTFDESIGNSLEFVKLAEKELEYDIHE